MKRKTKIIATIGPSSMDYQTFKKLAKEGMDFIRFNSAYGSREQYIQVAEHARRLRKKIIFDIRNAEALSFLDKTCMPDMVAVSFSESAQQMKKIQKIVPGIKLISKIESVKGVKNAEKIIDNSWGVMVARGDLGKTNTIERVPCLQRKIMEISLRKKKFVIVATEMLLSMVNRPEPTRAEASDVANAVFSKASAVMLSEETAIGKYPAESVGYMRRIVEASENCTH